jgi:hypothetical protein
MKYLAILLLPIILTTTNLERSNLVQPRQQAQGMDKVAPDIRQAKLLNTIEKRIERLTKVKEKIEQVETIETSTEDLDKLIDYLKEAQVKVQATRDPQALKQIAQEIREEWNTIKSIYRTKANSYALKELNKMKEAITKLEKIEDANLLNELSELNEILTQIEEAYKSENPKEARKLIISAKQKALEIKTLLRELNISKNEN